MNIDRDDLHLYVDSDTLFEAAAQRWANLAERSVARRGAFHVALSGGSTPRRLYESLTGARFRHRLPWDKIHIYFGDERCVPPEHPDSNYRMVKEALLQHVAIPATQIHRMVAESDDLEATAAGYAQLLQAQLPEDGPDRRFDLVMLGLGPDGHVASLFPHSTTLTEQHKWVVPVYVPALQIWRLTITLAVINQARHIMVLVSGKEKAAIMSEILKDYHGQPRYPIEMVHPRGTLEWYVDRAAAP